MQRQRQESAGLCNSLCPASETKVFVGTDIRFATAADGTRYGSLKNAFSFRTQLVPGCTCNGNDHFGLASIDPASDPTIRAGDILAAEATTTQRSALGSTTSN
jgi:hypothetical protein